ncbi:MAG: IS256 family transposase [Planctomycetota bacterium]
METLYHMGEEKARTIFEGMTIEERMAIPLDELARMGAQSILQAMLEEEVVECLGRRRYARGAQGIYRNGSRQRQIKTGTGDIALRYPKIAGGGKHFISAVIPAYKRLSPQVLAILPHLYSEGLSTRDFQRALAPLMDASHLSASSISRANRQIYQSFANWRKRDLSDLDIVYLFLDGISLKIRIADKGHDMVLVAHGITRAGHRVLVGLALGPTETGAAWKALLQDLVGRGLKMPFLVITDGGKGVIAAVKDVWPTIPRQRCAAHKVRNVLERVPKRRQDEVRPHLNAIFHATDLEAARAAVHAFIDRYKHDLTTAVEVLVDDLEACLTFYRFPEVHWKRIRTSNVIERLFGEVRRRTDVLRSRIVTEKAALVLVFATLEQNRLKWHGVTMTPEIYTKVAASAEECRLKPLKWNLDKQIAA